MDISWWTYRVATWAVCGCRDTAHLRMVDFRPGIKMIFVGTKRERERERERERASELYC